MDPVSIIVSGTALVATVLGYFSTRAGRADTNRQQAVANALEQREQKHKEDEAALQHARDDAEIAWQRLQVERAEVERLRAERAAEAEQLRAQLREALMDRSALQTIVADEIAKAAIVTERAIAHAEGEEPPP